jgi:DNA polymerase-3 subunit epsilon
MMLNDLPVLIIDCQATANHPRNGHLLEIGWLPMRASQSIEDVSRVVQTSMVRLPEGYVLPKVITRITGIGPLEMEVSSLLDDVWRHLMTDADAMPDRPLEAEGCPTVIHFARFETAFLKALHEQQADRQPFPLDIVCTHQLATRMLPDLPRKGLRAVAGYLGHSVPTARRCGAHLLATAVIWHHLVKVLHDDEAITTWAQLKSWLSENPAMRSSDRRYPMTREKLAALPNEPGVYRFLRSNGDVLYIGKARSLRHRVHSYFHDSQHHSEKNLEMLSQAVDLQWTPTHSGVEAALLESSEIKAHAPPYNRALMGDRRSIVFISPDFQHQSPVPDTMCRVGPLPSVDLYAGVHALGQWLEDETSPSQNMDDGLSERILGIPQTYGPDWACLNEGLRSFAHDHQMIFHRLGIWRGLMAIGRLSWLERLQDEVDEEQPDHLGPTAEPDSQEEETGRDWSPDVVARALRSRLRHCGRLLRRARWLTLLSESSVAWRDSENPEQTYRALVLKHGRVVENRNIHTQALLPIPPGNVRPLAERRACFDLEVYDRLRVMTTELRRLVDGNRSVVVCLRANVILGMDQLKSLLKWI